jgi:hypothetical protein
VPEVSQSTIVVGALLAAFIIWLAVNNRLGVYYNVVVGGGGGTGTGGASPNPRPWWDIGPGISNPGYDAGKAIHDWFGGLFGGGSTPAPTGGAGP